MDYEGNRIGMIAAGLILAGIFVVWIFNTDTLGNALGIKYTKLAWGTVEAISNPNEYGDIKVTVLFSTSDEGYTGTYRITFSTNQVLSVDESVLLMCTDNYKFATLYDECKFSGNPDSDEKVMSEVREDLDGIKLNMLSTVGKWVGTIVLGLVGLAGLCLLVYLCVINLSKVKKVERKLGNCRYVHLSKMSDMLTYLQNVTDMSKKCPDKNYRKIFIGIRNQMCRQLLYIVKLDQISADVSKSKLNATVDATCNSFEEIVCMVSDQLYNRVLDSTKEDREDFERQIYQLRSFRELEGVYSK